jgi:membrane-bound metal-dependent hydrolase YbcI (DUF457 family)
MASPVGHALIGVGLAALSVPLLGVAPDPTLWIGAVIASGVPDLDLVGVLLGFKRERVHRKATHSFFFLGVLAGLALWVSRWPGMPFGTNAVWVWVIDLLAHPLVDTLTTTGRPGQPDWGIPLFWPFSSRRYCVARPLVQPPSLDSYASKSLWRALWPELAIFGSTCLSMIVLGSLL